MHWYPRIPIVRDPESNKDWRWDFSAWLAESETITDAAIVGDTGALTVDASAAGQEVAMWVSGGDPRTAQAVTLRITTSDARVDDFTVVFMQYPG